MKILKQYLLIILLSLSFASVALSPDMQADRYLVQVEQVLKGKDKDYGIAAEAMDKIMALKAQHNLKLPIEFYFKYAKIMLKGNNSRADKAFVAINHYLTVAGKSGEHYGEALNLYDESLFWGLVYVKTMAQARKLLELGADVNAKVNGTTPLISAAYLSTPETIRILLALGADVNAKDDTYKSTALITAINGESDTLENIRTLIAAGADVNYAKKAPEGKLFSMNKRKEATAFDSLKYESKMNESDKAKVERWLKNPSLLR